MTNKVIISEALNELSKGVKVRKPIKESLDRNEIADFIDDSVATVESNHNTVCRHVFDRDLCLYVGVEGGFDDGDEICAKIGKRNDHDWTDMGWINQPFAKNGDVWDTCVSNPSGKDADYFIQQYNEIRKALDNGELLLESKKPTRRKSLKEGVYDWSFEYHDLIKDLAGRVSNPDDEDDILDSIDSGLIYYDDQWTAIKENANPSDVIGLLTDAGIDIYDSLSQDVYEFLHQDLNESKKHIRRKSLKEEKFSNKTNQGWTIVKKFKDLDDGRTHVIAKRDSGDYPYAIGLGYNEKIGSWGQGMYDYKTAEEAENALKHNNRYRPYNVELIEEMSPEDKADSDTLRRIEIKARTGPIPNPNPNPLFKTLGWEEPKKFTDDEQKVLDKLGVQVKMSPSSKGTNHVDMVDKNGDSLLWKVRDRNGHFKWDDPNANLADAARKRPERADKRNELDHRTFVGNEIVPGTDAELDHGEIDKFDSCRLDDHNLILRDTKRHPYLTKERQSQAKKMYEPMHDMKRALSDRKNSITMKEYAKLAHEREIAAAEERYQKDIKDADETKLDREQSADKQFADSNDRINKLLKRK